MPSAGPDWTAQDWFATGLGAINRGSASTPSDGVDFQETAIEGDNLWKVTTAGAPGPLLLNGTPHPFGATN